MCGALYQRRPVVKSVATGITPDGRCVRRYFTLRKCKPYPKSSGELTHGRVKHKDASLYGKLRER